MRHEALLLLSAMVLTGCNLAPAQIRPVAPVAPDWPEQPGSQGVAANRIGYADYFPDARLKALIALGLVQNRDLVIATARIAEARGFYRIQSAEQLPGLDASGSLVRNRTSASDAGGASLTRSRYSAGVVVPSFELDFWGRVRNLSDAARSQYLATEAGERAAKLSIVRSIAAAYWLEREAAERIQLAEATVQSRNEGVRIANLRLDAGVTSALDYRQAQSLLTQAQTELAALKLARAEAHNLLSVLVGGPLPDGLPEALRLSAQKPAQVLAAGLPSDLLDARPDIVAAEQQLRAARANVGAARAAFFPRIALTGGLGYASSDLGSLFSDDGLNWSFGPSISVPLFDWGRRKGNVDVTLARTDIAVASYEQTVQQAFREVADALAGRRYLAEEVDAQERAAAAQREIARLAQIRYREGVANYLEVLDAERNLFTAEQMLLSLRRQELSNLAALYAALGGGATPPG